MVQPRNFSPAVWDLILCCVVFVILFLVSSELDLLEMWFEFSRTHEDWELDEVFVAVALMTVMATWFAYRRWQETKAKYKQGVDLNRQLTLEIDAREQARRAVLESEARYREASKLAGLGYYHWDIEQRTYRYCSEELARIHGLSPAAFMERTTQSGGILTFVHPEDRPSVRDGIDRLHAGEDVQLEYRIVWLDGTIRYVKGIAQQIVDENGHVDGVVGVCLDISEMKQAETRLADAMDVNPAMFALFDPDDRLVVCNRKFRDQAETPETAVVPGVSFETILRCGAKGRFMGRTPADTERWIARRLNRRNLPAQNLEYVSRNGEWSEISDYVLSDGSVFTVVNDITERKRIEMILRDSQKMEAVRQLTGGVAHDFNNLLGSIMGNAELLLNKADNSQLQSIIRAAERGATLTERLLAFSRQQPLRFRGESPARLLNTMQEVLTGVLGTKISLTIDVTEYAWPMKTDAKQLENALLNLALNSRHAMPSGGSFRIVVENVSVAGDELGAKIDLRKGDYLALKVSDTGTGMSQQEIDHAFEPFFTTKDVGMGSGLGLSMVYGFAKQSGGDVKIESEHGAGTAVTLYLPRAPEIVLANSA